MSPQSVGPGSGASGCSVVAYTKAHQHDRVREALDLVYEEEPSRLDEALSQMQWASVTKDSW